MSDDDTGLNDLFGNEDMIAEFEEEDEQQQSKIGDFEPTTIKKPSKDSTGMKKSKSHLNVSINGNIQNIDNFDLDEPQLVYISTNNPYL